MNEFAFYLLKVTACSGIFYMFYWIALRNKVFHQWNRFYLLLAVAVSMLAPVFQFSFLHTSREIPGKAIQLLQVVTSANEYLEDVRITNDGHASYGFISLWAYILVSFVLLMLLLRSLARIFAIIRNNHVQQIDHICVVHSKAPGTPFSFLRYIFWNDDIELDSGTGQQIFLHEVVHVKERHTLDKLFIQLTLAVIWINPFFWLIRKELKLVHEFIADKQAVTQQGTAAFAAMILQSAYPGQYHMLASHFFQTSIKRRIQMLTRIQSPGVNYLMRLLALAVMACTVFAFTIRTTSKVRNVLPIAKDITVVIDAGHGKMPGGNFSGARQGNVYEDEIVLALAREIKNINQNDHIKILLSRNSDDNVDLHQRVEFARKSNADMFISLHVAAPDPNNQPAENRTSGFEIMVSNKEPFYQKESELLGSVLQQELNEVYYTYPKLLKRNTGIWVIDKNVCTSVLVECGYITDPADLAFITKKENYHLVAGKILNAIERFASEKNGSTQLLRADTIPQKQKENKPDQVHAQHPENEASVDKMAWRKFLEQNLQPIIESAAKNGAKPGQYTLVSRFLVEKDGSISHIRIIKDPGYDLGKMTQKLLAGSPKWEPAKVNGRPVKSYHSQPITFVIAEE